MRSLIGIRGTVFGIFLYSDGSSSVIKYDGLPAPQNKIPDS